MTACSPSVNGQGSSFPMKDSYEGEDKSQHKEHNEYKGYALKRTQS